MPDPVRFQLRKNLRRTFVIDVLDSASRIGRNDLFFLRKRLQQPRHKGAPALFQMAQHRYLGGIARSGVGSAKRFVHPPIVADPHQGALGVFYLFHRSPT